MARIGISNNYYDPASGTADWYGSDGGKSTYIPALYSKKVLRNLYEKTFLNDICNTDYAGEIKAYGDTVHIRRTPDLSVGDYTIGSTITYQVPDEDSTELNIDQAKYVAFRIDDVDAAQTDLSLVNMFAEDSAQKIKIAVETECLGYMATGAHASNQGAIAGAITGSVDLGAAATTVGSIAVTSTNAVDKIVEFNQVLDEINMDDDGRFVVLPAWYCARLKLGDLKRADITGDPTGVIRNGMVGMVDRTTIYQSNLLPHVTEGGNEIFSIIAGRKSGTTFANQITKTDTIKIPDSFGEYWRSLYVYGRKVVEPEAVSLMYAHAA